MKIIVTGTRKYTCHPRELNCFLDEISAKYVSREGIGLSQLQQKYAADAVVVWHETGPHLYYAGAEFFFHPSMAKNRIMANRKVNALDPMVKACSLQPGTQVLDCTLGMGSDALVAAYFSQTQVYALESSSIIAAVIRWGMYFYSTTSPWLKAALSRIEIITAEHCAYLQTLPSHSVDVVYFDPMFRSPLNHSQPLAPLRPLANARALTVAAVAEAQRVARQRVVLKELRDSGEFERLGFTDVQGSFNNRIAYGIISTAKD